MSYQLYSTNGGLVADAAKTTGSGESRSFIFSADNPDYRKFKSDIASGVALSDVAGMAMTAAQTAAFLATIP